MSKRSKLLLMEKRRNFFLKNKAKYLEAIKSYRNSKEDLSKRLVAKEWLVKHKWFSLSKFFRIYCPFTGNTRRIVHKFGIDARVFYNKLLPKGAIPGVLVKR